MNKDELLRNYGCLVLEWERKAEDEYFCRYYLNVPLAKLDIRAEGEDGTHGVKPSIQLDMGGTKVGCGREPHDTPFRDGAHIRWDSKKLNNLPMFLIKLDGSVVQIERNLDREE